MSKYDKEREAMGIKPVASSSSSSSSGKSKYDNERKNIQHSNENAQYADLMKQAYQSNPDSFTQSHPAPEPQGPSFLQQAGEVAQNVGSSALHGIGAALNAVGTGIDKFEMVTGLKNVGSAVKGLISPERTYQPDMSHGDSYLGNLQNLGSVALTSIKNAGKSAYEGLIHPDQADQRFQGNLNAATDNLDPVTKYSARFLGNAGTDPLTFIPIPVAPVLKAFRGIKGAAESGLAGNLVKDAKFSPESSVSKYAADREAIQTPDAAPTTSPAAVENATPAPVQQQNWFTNLFGNQGTGITPFGSTKRVGTGPVNTADQIVKSHIKTDAQGIKDSLAAQARATYQNFVDNLSPLKTISNKTYETAMDASRGSNIANTIVRDKFVTPEGQVVGEGLSNIFKKVARGQDKQFIDYLTLRHAETRMARGEQVFADSAQFNGQKMTPEVVRQKLDMYDKRHPGFAAIAKEWDGFNDNILQHFGVNEGLISPELYKALREKNPNYSPMQRQFSRSEKPGRNFLAKSTSSSFSGQKAPIKEVSPTGSMRNIVDPRKTTIESVGAWANAAMRNRTMQSIVDAVKANPEAFKGRIEIKPAVDEVKQSSIKEMNKLIDEHGVEGMLESLNKDFELLFKKSPNPGANKDNIVRAMVGGHPVELVVHDPELVKTLIGMGPQASNMVIDVLSMFSNATKRGATGLLSPVFAVKGATMDLVQSAIQAKSPIKQAGYTIYSIFSGIGDKLNIPGLKNLAEEYRRAGGGYSAALKGERRLNTRVSDMTRDPLLSPKGIAKGAINTIKAPFRALEGIGDIAENAPRIAAYKLKLKELGGTQTPDNVREAMNASREITVNFSRKGALSRDLEAAIPYNNAAVQGTYRVMKGIKDHPVRTAASIATLAVLPKLYEYAQFHDDPDYQSLPARERMRFLIVNKNDDGTFTKVPMEPAYNSIGEMTIEALRHFKDNDPNAFKGSMDALSNAWLPPAVTGGLQGVTQGGGFDKSIAGAINSTVAAPFVATVSNQSFTGAPIVSRAVSDRSPQYQYDERTSSIAKKLGEVSGMAPMKVDYLLRAYGGDPARLVLPLTSQVGQGNTRNTLLKNFIVDPTVTNNMTNDFYTMKDNLSRAYRDNKEVGVPLPTWYDDNLRREIDSTAKDSLSSHLSYLNDQKKAVSADKMMAPTKKTAQIRDIQEQINHIYLDINSKMQKNGVPMK
jgi:hypothetical protein